MRITINSNYMLTVSPVITTCAYSNIQTYILPMQFISMFYRILAVSSSVIQML
jgi:hypothetical protein